MKRKNTNRLRTQVIIVGGGPAGMLLAHMLHRRGVRSVVVEQRSRDYVLGRVRAGVLEYDSAQLLRQEELGDNLDRHSITQSVTTFARNDVVFELNTDKMLGKPMTIYGQTAVTADLYERRCADGAVIFHNAADVSPRRLLSSSPYVAFQYEGKPARVDGDFVVGCDGFHGVCRGCIPAGRRREYIKSYPFGWLGILSKTPPLPELLYIGGDRGFALCSKRRANLSRYYVQCSLDDDVKNWSGARFWRALLARCPSPYAARIVTGAPIEKSIAPLRSFICEPMRYGRLFLAGDAAHIVPPTGAKGLNMAMADARSLALALARFYGEGDEDGLLAYSDSALRRAWAVSRFSWWLTHLLHKFPDDGGIGARMQEAEFALLARSPTAQQSMAEQYTSLGG